MHARTRASLALFAVVAVLLAAAAIWQKDSLFPPPPAARQPLTIAVSTTYVGSGLLYIARDKQYFAEQGLDVTLLPHSSGRTALGTMLAQGSDLATSSNIPIMFAAMQGAPVSIVATIFTTSRENGVVGRRDRGIGTLRDLRGKTIGVTLGTDSHFVLSTMLAQQQARLDEVTIVGMPPDAMVESLNAGKVDAISTWDPVLAAASKALGGNASEFRTQGGFLFDFNLVGRKDWTASHGDLLQKLSRALLQAKALLDRQPQEGQKIIIDAMHMDADTFAANRAMRHFVVRLDQNLLIMLEDQTRWAINSKLTDATTMPDYLSAIDARPLTAVKPDAVTIVR